MDHYECPHSSIAIRISTLGQYEYLLYPGKRISKLKCRKGSNQIKNQGKSAETQNANLLGFAWITNNLDFSCLGHIINGILPIIIEKMKSRRRGPGNH